MRVQLHEVKPYRNFTVVRFLILPKGNGQVGVRIAIGSGDKHSATDYTRNTFDLYAWEVPDAVHEIALQALAYHALTGKTEGFPEQEFDL
jgi:hypothetical protein